MGVKDIASWLNARNFHNGRGNQFYTSTVHAILTREAYAGVFHYNRHDSRTRRERPREEWIALTVPQIIPPEQFQRVQDRLRVRRPDTTPPRVVNSAVLLTGLACCDSCGSPLMLSTGKSAKYRYYTCSARRLKGRAACPRPITVPMGEFDDLVLGALADKLLTPERLPALLSAALKHRRSQASGNLHRRSELRRRRDELTKKIGNLYDAVADGTVGDAPLFRDKLKRLEDEREETIRLLSQLDIETPSLRRALSKAQAQAVGAKLRRGLLEAPLPMQRRYVRGLVSQIVVDKEKAVISGPNAALAAAVTAERLDGEVRSFVREWRRVQSGENLLRRQGQSGERRALSSLFFVMGRAADLHGNSTGPELSTVQARSVCVAQLMRALCLRHLATFLPRTRKRPLI